jgi:Transposase DDE domain
MIIPPPDPDTIFAQLLQDFPDDFQEMAREFKAFTRARKIKTPAQLLRLVLLFAGLDLTEREIAANQILIDPAINGLTDQAVHQRLAVCQPWLEALLPKMLRLHPLPPLPSGLRLLVIDASSIAAPGQSKATHRLHIILDLVRLTLAEVKVTDYKTGETLKNFSFAAGDVVMCDRVYGRQNSVAAVLEAGAEIIVRYNAANFPLQDLDGQPLNIAQALREAAPGETMTLPARFVSHQGQPYEVWIHAYRLTGADAQAARRRCRRTGQRSGYRPRQETLFLAEFVLVLTSLPPEVLDAKTVLALYRCRWQVELLIKVWKSLLDLDRLRARAESVLSKVWLHGKLIYATLIEGRLRRRCPQDWGGLDQQRPATYWRMWKLTQKEVEPMITLSECWQEQSWAAAQKALAERPRRRRLQSLPKEVVVWLQDSLQGRTPELKLAA